MDESHDKKKGFEKFVLLFEYKNNPKPLKQAVWGILTLIYGAKLLITR